MFFVSLSTSLKIVPTLYFSLLNVMLCFCTYLYLFLPVSIYFPSIFLSISVSLSVFYSMSVSFCHLSGLLWFGFVRTCNSQTLVEEFFSISSSNQIVFSLFSSQIYVTMLFFVWSPRSHFILLWKENYLRIRIWTSGRLTQNPFECKLGLSIW